MSGKGKKKQFTLGGVVLDILATAVAWLYFRRQRKEASR